ncbi:MAG: UvrD-helicase domain-containing protein, partial [Bacteroidales bacterium]|nr:UvrD-helicase domain-containing protein [Bacteroidales bacterium]
QLLLKSENDKALLNWLTMFAESLIEKGDHWNFKKSIHQLGMEIFNEKFRFIDEKSLSLIANRNFLNEYKSTLIALSRNIESESRTYGVKATSVIGNYGFTIDDFSNKERGPAGFLEKLSTLPLKEPNTTARNATEDPKKWFTAGSSKKNLISQVAQQELMPLMQQYIAFYEANSCRYYTALAILKNLYTLGILTDLSQLAAAWCADNNAFLLAEAPGFLRKIIDGNDTPFIYEKAGCWYHHFMIDEFQDTSQLQWLNFKPLISNSLSQGFDNLAVGDAKQSIYRWRNSNWEILEYQIHNDFAGAVQAVTLNENWRSLDNIIAFNNRFFSDTANIIREEFNRTSAQLPADEQLKLSETISRLYGNSSQQPGDRTKKGGLVQVEYIQQEEELAYTDAVCLKIADLLCQLQDKGYRLSDIALLTRTNREAKLLADFLLQQSLDKAGSGYRFDVISDEALRLGSSLVVNTLVALLQYLLNNTDRTNNYLLQAMLENYLMAEKPDRKWLNPDNTVSGKMSNESWLPKDFLELAASSGAYTLLEIVERTIKIFHFENFTGEMVYLQAFRDLVMRYTQQHGGDLSRFLDFWNETGKEVPVSAPASQDAIRILTLHKSKGLEFKVTIIPFCNWELVSHGKSFIWCKPIGEPFDKLPALPLQFGVPLKHTLFAADYHTEYYRQLIDNINLLYVAFTRAREAMFIYAKPRKDDQLKTISDVLVRVLGNSNHTEGFITTQVNAEKPQESVPVIPESATPVNIVNRLRIAFQGKLMIDPQANKPSRPVNEGRLLHAIFTNIKYAGDASAAMERAVLSGLITVIEQSRYADFIQQALKNEQVADWYKTDWKIINEAEIVMPGGSTRRPDRVMTRNNTTVVVDYKFGALENPAYEKQVRDYARLLTEMGYRNVTGYLWYVTLSKIIAC